MHFNPEINLGTVIEIAIFLVAVLGAARKFGALETKVNMMYDWWLSGSPRDRHQTHGD